ncbi:putative reverse transcriptase domain-containing protein [Tanacetum coccineum]
MNESAKRHEENSNMIKEIQASTDAAVRNQRASIKTLEIQIGQISKEKDLGSFTLPSYINNVFFDNALADLGASVSVMPLSTYLNLGSGELADRTVKYPKGIAENVLVGIGKFVFPIDFIILDMPEDVKVPLILGRPFLSTARAKIDVFKRKITLRVGDEKIIFKSVKPASSLIKRVHMLSLRERMELDLEVRLMGVTLVSNRSLDHLYEEYIELNDLNVPLELRRDQVDDLMPTIKEGEVIDKPMIDIIKTRNNESFDEYPSFCDFDQKIHIDCAYKLRFSYMIGFEHVSANFFPILSVNMMSREFYNSIIRDKVELKGKNVVRAFINVRIFVRNFSVITHFVVVENMDGYRDQDMGDIILGEPFYKASCVEARRFDGLITIHNDSDNMTYQMERSHPRFKHLSNAQCNKIKPLLKTSIRRIRSIPYGVLNVWTLSQIPLEDDSLQHPLPTFMLGYESKRSRPALSLSARQYPDPSTLIDVKRTFSETSTPHPAPERLAQSTCDTNAPHSARIAVSAIGPSSLQFLTRSLFGFFYLLSVSLLALLVIKTLGIITHSRFLPGNSLPTRIMLPRAMTQAAIEKLVFDRVAAALAQDHATRGNTNGADRSNGNIEGNAQGQGGVPSACECTYSSFMKCNPTSFYGNEGTVELCRWFEKTKSVFSISECAERNKVANAKSWNDMKIMMREEFCPPKEIQRMEVELWNLRVKDSNISAYTQRFNELVLLCPEMVPSEKKKVEAYLRGLPENIKGETTSSRPVVLNEAVRMAHTLMEQKLQAKAERIAESNKRKHGNARALTTTQNAGANQTGVASKCNRYGICHFDQCPPKCNNCGKMGHKEKDYRSRNVASGTNARSAILCYECGERGHKSNACPKKADRQGGNVRGQAYVVRDAKHNQGLNVVTGTFLLNNRYVTILFDSAADKSFVDVRFSHLLDIKPAKLNTSYEVKLADGKVVCTNTVLKGCTLNLLDHLFDIDLMPIELGTFEVIIGMD